MHAKDLVKNYWKAINNRDWDRYESLIADDILYQLPQTREQTRGKKACRAFNETYPGEWTLSVVDLLSDGDRVVSKISFVDNGTEQTAISFFELEHGLIKQIVEYWPDPYDPPKRNFDLVEYY